jgi:hypothetical protein
MAPKPCSTIFYVKPGQMYKSKTHKEATAYPVVEGRVGGEGGEGRKEPAVPQVTLVDIKLCHAVGNKLRIFHQLCWAPPLDLGAGGHVVGPLPAAEERGVGGREVRVLPGLLAARLQTGTHLN